MNPFEAYVKYLAYKMHFKSAGYDYIKYNGKVKADGKSFDTRNDKYMFHKLSKIDDLDNYLIANLTEKPDIWVGNLFSEQSRNLYLDMIRRQQSITYLFETDLNKIDSLQDDIKSIDGKHPIVLKMYKQGLLIPETLIALDRLMGIFNYWDNKIQETYLWPSIRLKLTKYGRFVQLDEKKLKGILKSSINSVGT